jgi:hypothetical protein
MPRTPAQAAAARARAAAQRRTAKALHSGKPVLPARLREPVRAAQRRAVLHNPDVMEQRIGDKPDDFFPEIQFRDNWQYSADTVRYMAGHMTDEQREQALTISTSEYRQLASEQNGFNVFWYHPTDDYPQPPE